MGTHYITHTCGHEAKHVLTVAEEKRNKVEWLESVICPACYEKQRQAERAAEAERAKAATSHLPELTGSEKQVAWATTIRAKVLKVLPAATEKVAKPEELKQWIMELVQKETQAKFWINNFRSVQSGGKLISRLYELDGDRTETIDWGDE